MGFNYSITGDFGNALRLASGWGFSPEQSNSDTEYDSSETRTAAFDPIPGFTVWYAPQIAVSEVGRKVAQLFSHVSSPDTSVEEVASLTLDKVASLRKELTTAKEILATEKYHKAIKALNRVMQDLEAVSPKLTSQDRFELRWSLRDAYMQIPSVTTDWNHSRHRDKKVRCFGESRFRIAQLAESSFQKCVLLEAAVSTGYGPAYPQLADTYLELEKLHPELYWEQAVRVLRAGTENNIEGCAEKLDAWMKENSQRLASQP